MFLAFQYPVEIPGVSNANFLKTAYNEKRKHQGLEPADSKEFIQLMREKSKLVELDLELTKRSVNEGFSGGEKKRSEILQLLVLEPKYAILDETDSGLDVDALKVVSQGVNAARGPEFGALVITHYQRLLNHIVPDVVHVIAKGRVVKTGPKELAMELDDKGYDWLVAQAA